MNGFGGVDFLDADADGYRRAGEALLETGVTAYLPTFITAPEEQLLAALARGARDVGRARASSASTSRARSSPPGGSGPTRAGAAATRTARCSSGCSPRGRSG